MRNSIVRVAIGAMVAAASGLGACSGDMPKEDVGVSSEALSSNARILNFEAVGSSDWSTSTGSIASTTDRVEGAYAMAATNTGNATFVSANLVTLGNISNSLTLDIK